jgi:Zn-ribbon RNA-binding protein
MAKTKADQDLNCISCGKRIETERDWVRFKCPKCGDHEILRCEKCKKLVNPYKCPKCRFEGP